LIRHIPAGATDVAAPLAPRLAAIEAGLLPIGQPRAGLPRRRGEHRRDGRRRPPVRQLADRRRVRAHLDILQVDRCRFDPENGAVLAVLNDDATVTYNGHPYDVRRHGLPTDSEIALVVQSGEQESA
jgi:hypothetical protein